MAYLYLALGIVMLAMTWLTVCLLAQLPLAFVSSFIGRRSWRFAVAALGGYLILATVTGFCAYALVPAQYARNHHWTRLPNSSSLGEQYAVAMERAESIAPRNPDEARRLRAHVVRERDDFVDDWLLLGTSGLAMPLLLLLWGWRNGWYLLPRRIPPHD